MKSSIRAIVLLLSFSALLSFAGNLHDINSDGRLDQEDVAALGRMVAGLDPVRLECDQNHDGVIDLSDVNLLLESLPADADYPSMPGISSGKGPATENPPSRDSSTRFYAVQRKIGGQCLVVVGDEGLEAGDLVFGAFPSFQQAQYQVVSRCGGAPATGSTPATQGPSARQKAGLLTVSISKDSKTSSGIYSFDPMTGKGFFIDKVGKKPYQARRRPMRHSCFSVIGRPEGRSARPGEILMEGIRGSRGVFKALLFVDTTTGKMGYLSGLDVDPTGGRLRPLPGSPAAGLAGPDGNYLLMMRLSGSGKTLGAYLYHATTGECRLFREIFTLPSEAASVAVSSLPSIPSGTAGCTLSAAGGATEALMLIDPDSGRIYRVDGVRKGPAQLRASTLSANTSSSFGKASAPRISRPFVPMPVEDSSGKTSMVLILDATNGGLAMLTSFRKSSKARLTGVSVSVSAAPCGDLAMVPRIDDGGRTKGAWIFEPNNDRAFFLKSLQDAARAEIREVSFNGN